MLMMGLSLFTACKDDEDEVPAFDEPEIEAIGSQLQQQAGESVNIRIDVVAEAVIRSVTASGDAEEDLSFVSGDNSQVVTHSFMVPAAAEE